MTVETPKPTRKAPAPTTGPKSGLAAAPKRRRREVALGALVSRQVERSAPDAGAVGRLASQWGALCPLLGAYCWPIKLQRGVLQVGAVSDSVRQELRYAAPTLVEAANMVLGYSAVQEVQTLLRPRPQAPGAAPRTPLKPRAEAMDRAADACKGTADSELREALMRLGAWVGEAALRKP